MNNNLVIPKLNNIIETEDRLCLPPMEGYKLSFFLI